MGAADLCLSLREIAELCRTPQRARHVAFLRQNGAALSEFPYASESPVGCAGRSCSVLPSVCSSAATRAARSRSWARSCWIVAISMVTSWP